MIFKNSKKRTLKNVIIYFVLIIGSIIMILPFLWMLSTSFKTSLSTFVFPPQFIPREVTLEHYQKIMDLYPMGRFLMNSTLVAVLVTLGQMLISAMAAYVFARMEFRGKNALFLIYLATLMVPFQVTVTPLFIIMVKLNWLNSYQALIVPLIFSAFSVFLLRQFFLTIPKSLEEAAFIDGASHFTIFNKIMLPLAKPALATVTIFAFMESWNNYLWPLIVINDTDYMTLPLALANLQGRWTTDWNALMAGTVITVVPIIIVYLFAQKHFIEGLTHTGIK